MNKRKSFASCFSFLLSLTLLAASTDGATFALKVVGVNGRPVPRLSHVTVRPGDVVELDVFLSGWADYGSSCVERRYAPPCETDDDCYSGPCEEFRLRTFQYALAGLRSGESGALLPLSWDGPRVSWPCAADTDCGAGGVCRSDSTCGPMANCTTCPSELVCPVAPLVCVGTGHDPASGTFIDHQRPDFAFPDLYVISAVRFLEPEIAAGATLFNYYEAVPDAGQPVYVGTVSLVPTTSGDPAGEASGTFVVDFTTGGPVGGTFIINQGFYETVVTPDFEPVTIKVVRTGPARFGYVGTSQGGAASPGTSAIRVTLRKMYNTSADDPDGAITCPAGRLGPSLSQFEGQTRWLGAPMQLEDDAVDPQPDYLAAPLVCTPEEAEQRDWSAGALAAAFGNDVRTDRLFFFGCEVVPCSIYEVAYCTNPMDESTCQAVPGGFFTLAVGDAADPHGRVADPNFADIGAIVEKFKARATPHETKALFKGNVVGDLLENPERKVSFQDIGAAVNSFKRIPYEEQGPCDPATGIDNCGHPCSTAP